MADAPDRHALLHEAGPMRLRRCRHGLMLYSVNDLTIGRSLDIYGEFSEAEVAVLQRLLRPGDIALDIGANIGALTLPMARAVGAAGRIVAFEPQPVLFQTLCANVALNGLLNVRTVNAAAGADAGSTRLPRLDFTRPDLYGAHGIGSDSDGDLTMVVRLDDALRLPGCRLIKIDVEGMEAAVIGGAEALIRRHRPILYVENDRKAKSAALIERLFGLGYALHWDLPPLDNPRNYRGAARRLFPDVRSINMLGTLPEHGVAAPEASRIRAPGDWWRDERGPVDPVRDDPLAGPGKRR